MSTMDIFFQSECIVTAIIIALIALDMITGTAQALKNKTFKSSKMRQGVWHKVGIITIMVLTWLLGEYGKQAGLPQDITGIIPIVNTALVVMESASIMENIAQINPELRKLMIFKVLKDESDKLNEEVQDDKKSRTQKGKTTAKKTKQ